MLFTFPVFDHKYPSWAIWSKNLKLLKMKFDTKTNLTMQNSMVVSIFPVLD